MKRMFLLLIALCAGFLFCAPCAMSASQDAFNPWLNKKSPNLRETSADAEKMLGQIGARKQSIEEEAGHRPHWKNELYPVVFGNPKADNEIIVVMDFSAPNAEKVWNEIARASRSLSPETSKIVLYGRNSEHYGTDLTGMAIWLSYAREGQAIPYMSHALRKWNEAKAARGGINFANEYDAVAGPTDLPIIYAYFQNVNPPVPEKNEPKIAKYCYDAGNANAYQAVQVMKYYGADNLPAVIVNGKILSNPSAKNILSAIN